MLSPMISHNRQSGNGPVDRYSIIAYIRVFHRRGIEDDRGVSVALELTASNGH